MNAEHTNYDLLYNPRLTVKGYPQIVERWQRDAQKARAPGIDLPIRYPLVESPSVT